jgi:hypothetical protein
MLREREKERERFRGTGDVGESQVLVFRIVENKKKKIKT